MKKWFLFLSLLAAVLIAVPVEADVGPPTDNTLINLSVDAADQVAIDCQAYTITPMAVDVVFIWPMEVSAADTAIEMQTQWATSPPERQSLDLSNTLITVDDRCNSTPDKNCTLSFDAENLITLRFY